jgi:hypothetical protein
MVTNVTTRDSELQISAEVSEIRADLFRIVRKLRIASRQTLSSAHSKRLLHIARGIEQLVEPVTTLFEHANAKPKPELRP